MKNLVIVESPNKIKKLQQYLGSDYKLMSSIGHIRDLAKKGEYRLGIDWENIKPFYTILKDKKEIVEDLKSNAEKSDVVWLATDPDREGEAIAWHLKEVLNCDEKIKRITFNAITESQVKKAITQPREIDYDLVRAQESRRIVDRVVGFRLSKLVQQKIKARSAGRVQSAVLKILLEREKEIENFVPEKWWTLEAEYKENMNFIHVNEDLKIHKVSSANELDEILNKLTEKFSFVDKIETRKTVSRPDPLEMSSYLSGMYSNFGMTNTSASISAQKLYENGHISYPRTDSTRISSTEFLESVEKYINQNFGKEAFLKADGNRKRRRKVKNTEQDAHEAIRPTDINKTPEMLKASLSPQEFKAYSFIWKISVQAFMIDGTNKINKYILDNSGYKFIFSISQIDNLGYRILNKEKDALATKKIIREFEKRYIEAKEDVILKKEKIKVIENSTHPPSHYTQSSLIKKMKDSGIGRPSTYSPTTKLLFDRRYVIPNNSSLIPSDLGKLLVEKLDEQFSDILNEKYTQEVEDMFELIAHNELDYKDFLKNYYTIFEERVEDAFETMEVKILPPDLTGESCPNCGKPMERKYSSVTRKFFEACTNYPECKYIKGSELKKDPLTLDEKCPHCEKNLLIRFHLERGPFKACSNFPRCRKYGAKPIEEKEIKILEELNETDELKKYYDNIKKREERQKKKKK